MIGFALKTLRHRKAGFAGAFVALLCAAALVCACFMLLETGLRATVAAERYAGAPVIVAGDQFVHKGTSGKSKSKPLTERRWIPASVADQLVKIPGVTKVVPEVTFPINGYVGHGWESAALTPFTLASGRPPRAEDEIVVDARGSGIPGYRVVGVTRQALPSQRTVFFTTAEARRLAGRPGQLSAIGVFPAVPVKVDGALTYTGEERGAVEFLDAEQSRVKLISLGGALGGTSLLVAILVVVGTFALSIQQRQRELALLRAVAATPRQIRKLLGGEALLVSVVAGVLGAAGGIGLGFWLRARFVALGAMPENLPLVVSPFPALAALLATVAAAWVAARVSARRTARIRPVEALGEAAIEARRLPIGRLLAGLGFLAGGVALTIVLSQLEVEAASSPVTMMTALVWTIAVSLLGPLLARASVSVLGVALRASRVGGWLAAKNLGARSKRLASVLSPLSLMVAMACTILFTQTTMGHAAQEQAVAGNRADYVLPGARAEAVRKIPGVEAVSEVLRTTVRVELQKYGAQAVTYDARTMDLGVVAGSMRGFGGDTVALSETAASRLELAVGGRLELTLGDGTPAALKVVAIYSRGLGFGELTLPHALVVGHVDDPSGTLLVKAAPSAKAALGRIAPPQAQPVQASSAEVNYVAMGLIIAFTAIAVVNTLAMSTSDRSRELALLRLVGATRRQLLRMLRLETLTAVLVSVLVGTVISLVTLSAFSMGMTGSPVPYADPLTYLGVVVVAAALALLATAVPARFAFRERPAEAIGARE